MLDGLKVLGLKLTPEQVTRLDEFRDLVLIANRVQNLTALESDFEVAVRHVLDSLTCLGLRDLFDGPARVIDIGTGAGFPGVPLRIARPRLEMTLLDSSRKRAAFLEEAVARLGLDRCRVATERAERFSRRPGERESYDVAVVRAVAPLVVDLEYGVALVRPGGHFVAFKGPKAAGELGAAVRVGATLGAELAEAREIILPLAGERRMLIVFRKISPTPAAYPRREGLPAKRPLA